MSNNPRLKIGAKTVAEADLPSIQKKKQERAQLTSLFSKTHEWLGAGIWWWLILPALKKKIIRLITPDTAYDYKKGPLWN